MIESWYQQYLKSVPWMILRHRTFIRDGIRCVRCRATERLEVHHLTYVRVGHEDLDDLVTLCDECHVYTHARQKAEAVVRRGGGLVRVGEFLPAVFDALRRGWEEKSA